MVAEFRAIALNEGERFRAEKKPSSDRFDRF
jgi:hypothetical protein